MKKTIRRGGQPNTTNKAGLRAERKGPASSLKPPSTDRRFRRSVIQRTIRDIRGSLTQHEQDWYIAGVLDACNQCIDAFNPYDEAEGK